mgnify:CR=1 FL=1
MSKEIEYFIPGNTPSLKNSKVKTQKGIFMSKTCRNYLASLNITYYSSRDKEVRIKKGTTNKFLEAFEGWVVPDKQIVLGFHFVRGSRHTWDLGNISQIIMDLMTAHKLIEDDNMDWVVPQAYKKDGKYYSYSKESPGVYIKIIEE